MIDHVQMPEGPITIKRYDPNTEKIDDAKRETISTQMIARVAKAFKPEHPINFDRVLGGSYNTRSVLEALIANTPQFYACYPGRIDSYTGEIEEGHKHVIWCPNDPHEQGRIEFKDTDMVISEGITLETTYDSLVIPDDEIDSSIDIESQRRHAYIQIALILIGIHLDYKIWVARNDWNITYKEKKVIELQNVIDDLSQMKIVKSYSNAIKSALLIDCLWFRNSRFLPAVMEVEHTTGVTSGLIRMKKFYDQIPPIQTRYVIVAKDEDRQKVTKEANLDQFRDLDARYFPYSAVEELLWLCQKRNISGVTDEFLDCYMEKVVE